MEIRLKKSNMMDGKESRTIRVPAELRYKYNIKLGEFVNLRGKDGTLITLQVEPAYKEQVAHDSTSAYASKAIFETIQLENVDTTSREIEVVDTITLGCDPEFFLADKANKGILHASRYFVNKNCQVGYDHGGYVAEFRPNHHQNETVVCDNIYNLILQARAQINKNVYNYVDPARVTMIGASHFKLFSESLTAGFHLHYGIPYNIFKINDPGSVLVINQIIKCLDYYIGVLGIIPEGAMDSERRINANLEYGKPGGYRRKFNLGTLEYRVPGGNLLRHPVLTKGLLGLGAIVIEDVISRVMAYTDGFLKLDSMTSLEDLHELYPNIPDVENIFGIICSQSVDRARSHLDTIVADIKKMVGFEKRESSVNEFFNAIYSGIQYSPDIELNWLNYYKEKGGKEYATFA